MFRSSVAILTISSLLSPASLAAPCSSPFAASPEQFKLDEQLSCSSTTSPVKLEIILQDTTMAGTLTAACDKNSPYFSMSMGENMVSFSDPLANSLSTLVRISDSCNGKPAYLIDRQPTLYTLPNGTKINTSIRVFAQDNNQTLIGFVAATEDTTNGIVLRAADDTGLATATKKFFSGSTCRAEWTVSNPGKTEQISSVIAMLINLKDNPDMSCLPQLSCPSPAGTIATTAVVTFAATAAVFIGGLLFLRYQYPNYYKALQ